MSTGERHLPGTGPEVRLLALRADVSGALARGGELRAVLRECAEALVRHLDAAFARIWTVDRAGNTLELQASAGLYTHLDGAHSRVPVGALKIGRIAQERKPHLTNDVPNDPQVSDREWAARAGMVAFAGYPLVVEGQVVGVVALFARHPLSEAALEALAFSADGIAQFVARKQVEWERAALLERQAAEHRFVGEASTVLASSLDYQTLLASVARLAVPRLADWCGVHIAEEGGTLRQLAVAHVDPAKVELAREVNRRYPHDPDDPRGVPQVVRTGRAELVPEITDEMLARGARDPAHLAILRELGLRSCMIVPMAARGRTLGALTFVSAESGRRYGPDDLALAEDLGRRAAVAIDNARLYSEAQEALRLREQAVGQLSLLVEASTSLTGTPGLPAVLGAILDLSHRLVAADAYAIWRQHPAGHWEIASSAGLSEEYVRSAGRVETGGPMPDHPVLAEDVGQTTLLEARRVAYRAEGIASLLAVPLRIRGEVSGTLTFYYRTRQRFGETTVRLASALANLAATAVGMSELYTHESELRARAEQAREGLLFLADASSALASSLDYRETLERVAGLAVPRLADWCVVDVVEPGGSIRQAAVAHVDPEKVRLAWELDRHYPDNPDAPAGVPKVVRTGLPELFPDISDALLTAIARDAEHLGAVRRLGLRSGMIVPLAARGRVLGTVSLGSAESGRRYGPDDLALAEELARRAALALDNARLVHELREADRRKDEFLAMLAHELRNPLAPVLTGLHILRLPSAGPGPQEHARAMMERQVQHLSRLVDALLDVSRITRGVVQVRRERLDLAGLVRTTAEDRRRTLESAGLRLELEVGEGPVWVAGDATRLAQVLNHLLDNAVKFKDGGDRVVVRLGVDGGRGQAVLSVRDFGAGIEADDLPRLFTPFAQADRSLERTKGGLGLGLALVKGLVALHGGEVSAASAGPGRGAEFTVRLPLKQELPALSAAPAAPGAPAAEPRRVLVVEDSRDAADSLCLLLELLGHEVAVAYTGPDGVRVAREWRPDVVLCDIGLPGLDGYAVAGELRRHPATANAQLIAVTGYGQPEDRRRSRQAGFDHHLVKPVDPEVLQPLLGRPA